MTIESQLKILGLHNSEIRIYIFLLRNGLSPLSTVSRGTKIGRTNCYKIFSELEEKHLIEKRLVDDKSMYLAKDPEAIVDYANMRVRVAERANRELLSLYKANDLQPQIVFYAGDEGVNDLLDQLKSINEISLFTSGSLPSTVSNWVKAQSGRIRLFPCAKGVANSYILWESNVGIVANSKLAHVTVISNADFYNSTLLLLKRST